MKSLLFFIFGFILLAVFGKVLWGWLTVERQRMRKRIERIQQRKMATSRTMQESLRRKTGKPEGLIAWLTKPLPNFKRLEDLLIRAGLTSITPKQYALRRLLFMLVIMAAVTLIFKKSLLAGLICGAVFGVWLPIKFLQFKIGKMKKAFLRLFPDAIDLIVRGLRSGLPVSESLVLVSHEVPDPVGEIFANVANTMKLGVPMEKALQETARRLDITEFNFFTTSIILQRETGGNLSEILNNLSEVLRARFLMGMKIKAMSSEARASAMIIGALPFVVIAAVSVLTPHYLTPLYTDHRGNICALGAIGMMGTGLWIMNRMTKFEI